MKILGRFAIRPDKDNKAKLIIGAAVLEEEEQALKTNVIYELQAYNGQVILVEVGAPAMEESRWGRLPSDIIYNEPYLVTKEEYKKIARP